MATQTATKIVASAQLSPEDQIEVIRTRDGSTALLRLQGRKTFYGRRFTIRSVTYVAADDCSGVPAQMVLATDIGDCESLEALVTEVANVMCSLTGVEAIVAELSARLAVTTHFAEWLDLEPRLVLSGSDPAQSLRFMRVLACFTRHSLPLATFSPDYLSRLAPGCSPTFCISDPSLPGEQIRLITATQYPRFGFVNKGKAVTTPFTAIMLDPETLKTALPNTFIVIDVTPQTEFELIGATELSNIARKYQPRLLGLRMKNWPRISRCRMKPPGLDGSTLAVASAVASVFDNPGSQSRVFELLKGQGQLQYLGAMSAEPNVVLDALLTICHQEKTAVYVQEVTAKVNGILELQGEVYRLKPRRVGTLIRSLNLPIEPRDSNGYKLLLNRAMKDRIHELGRSHHVMFFTQEIPPCEFCQSTAPMS